MLASAGGRRHALRCTIAARQEFAGYWEYMLDEAIYTAPAHPSWGGAGLIGGQGKLLGIGSLVMQQQDGRGRRVDLNMVVPAGLLAATLADLLAFGRPNKPARPWLGLYATEDDDGVVVSSLARRGPAEKAGLREGDRILSVEGTVIGLGERVSRHQAAPDPQRRCRQARGAGHLDRPAQLPEGAAPALITRPAVVQAAICCARVGATSVSVTRRMSRAKVLSA